MKQHSFEDYRRVCIPLLSIAAGVLIVLQPVPAEGVILGFTQGNLTPPADDPGFDSVSSSGGSGVYLGDSWVLTARHAITPNSSISLNFAGESFSAIPNTWATLHNPAGMGLTSETDLQLFRIDGNPDLPSVRISSSTPPVGAQVTMIGKGRRREDSPRQWNVQKNGDDWRWTETSELGDYRGFRVPSSNPSEKRWGTNRIEDDFKVTGENDPGHTSVVDVNGRDTISLLTLWDESGGTANEAQAVAGDSGGGVFYKRNGRWELAGILNAVLMYPDQHPAHSIYGQATVFADLSVYRSQILSLMDNPNYSVVGDINVDGIVSGDGSGSPESDDLAAFVGGWLKVHPTANIDSWKLGDLNQDAITDLHDFRLLRNVYPSASALASTLGIANAAAVPEPATWLLLATGGLAAWGLFRRRSG